MTNQLAFVQIVSEHWIDGKSLLKLMVTDIAGKYMLTLHQRANA